MKKLIAVTLLAMAVSGCFGKKSFTITHKETGASVTISEAGIEEIEVGGSVDIGGFGVSVSEEATDE